jgi:hypothetical protein
MTRAQKTALWLGLIALLGVAVHLAYYFPHDSLWYDEALTAYVANDSWETLWQWCTQVDIQVPFHYVVLRLWSGIAGDSEFMLRVVSALSLPLTVAAAIFIGRRVSGMVGLGLAVGILIGVLPGTLWIAYEVRAYAVALATFSWATAFLVTLLPIGPQARPLSGRVRHWRLIVYAVLMAAALYSHYTTLAGFVAHGLISLYFAARTLLRDGGLRQALTDLLPVIVAGLLFVPWLPILLARGTADRSFYAGAIPPMRSLNVLAGFMMLGRQDEPFEAAPFVFTFTILIGMGVLSAVAWPRLRRAAWIGGVLGAVPVTIVVALLLINPKLTGRYFWPAWIGADMLLSLGVVALTAVLTRRESVHAVLSAALAALIALIPYGTGQRGEAPNVDYRAAFAEICTQGTPNDVILLRDGTQFVAERYYGRRPPCETPRHTIGMPDSLIPDVTQYLDLGELQAKMLEIAELQPPNVWVISWQGEIMDPQALTYALLDTTATRTPLPRQYGELRLDRYTNLDAAALRTLAIDGPLTEARWLNITPVENGPTLIAVRMVAPARAKAGDRVVVHTWWNRGAVLVPELRGSARITTTDNGWIYAQVDQPPSGWQFYDDRWTPGIPAFGRYELVIGDDVPVGAVTVRYAIYDTRNTLPVIVIPLGDILVTKP